MGIIWTWGQDSFHPFLSWGAGLFPSDIVFPVLGLWMWLLKCKIDSYNWNGFGLLLIISGWPCLKCWRIFGRVYLTAWFSSSSITMRLYWCYAIWWLVIVSYWYGFFFFFFLIPYHIIVLTFYSPAYTCGKVDRLKSIPNSTIKTQHQYRDLIPHFI